MSSTVRTGRYFINPWNHRYTMWELQDGGCEFDDGSRAGVPFALWPKKDNKIYVMKSQIVNEFYGETSDKV